MAGLGGGCEGWGGSGSQRLRDATAGCKYFGDKRCGGGEELFKPRDGVGKSAKRGRASPGKAAAGRRFLRWGNRARRADFRVSRLQCGALICRAGGLQGRSLPGRLFCACAEAGAWEAACRLGSREGEHLPARRCLQAVAGCRVLAAGTQRLRSILLRQESAEP